MKPEEAISILKSWRITGDKSHEAVNMSIEALEKQIPLKHLPYEMGVDGAVLYPCGNCGEDVKRFDYCPWCGQKICWEKE